MRFKTIFLIFAIAMFMLAGVALAEDDDQGDNDDSIDTPCPYGIVIESGCADFDTVIDSYNGECYQIILDAHVSVGLLQDDDEENNATLHAISKMFEDMIPETVLFCPICEDITKEQVRDVSVQAVGNMISGDCQIAISQSNTFRLIDTIAWFSYDSAMNYTFRPLEWTINGAVTGTQYKILVLSERPTPEYIAASVFNVVTEAGILSRCVVYTYSPLKEIPVVVHRTHLFTYTPNWAEVAVFPGSYL